MADVLLFHHALGRTDGVQAFADELRAAGHEVTVPDLYEGRSFTSIEAGLAHVEELGFETIISRGVSVAEGLRDDLVYAGFSLGVMPAQWLAQRRPGARGALLYHSAVPLGEFGEAWPDGVPLQMHIMVDDPFDDLDVMQSLAAASGQLYTYPGTDHLFTDRSVSDYDQAATELVMQRTLDFLTGLD